MYVIIIIKEKEAINTGGGVGLREELGGPGGREECNSVSIEIYSKTQLIWLIKRLKDYLFLNICTKIILSDGV